MRTEKEKMLGGELYDPLDPELVRFPPLRRSLTSLDRFMIWGLLGLARSSAEKGVKP
jgi:hypothetical protein